MKNTFSLRLAFVAVAALILLPINGSGKHFFSNYATSISAGLSSGSPLPPPNPSLVTLSASGSPLPPPNPSLVTSGSPLPPPNPSLVLAISPSA
jgi:hypothetical protein